MTILTLHKIHLGFDQFCKRATHERRRPDILMLSIMKFIPCFLFRMLKDL